MVDIHRLDMSMITWPRDVTADVTWLAATAVNFDRLALLLSNQITYIIAKTQKNYDKRWKTTTLHTVTTHETNVKKMYQCLANAERPCDCSVLRLRPKSLLCSCPHSTLDRTSFGSALRSRDSVRCASMHVDATKGSVSLSQYFRWKETLSIPVIS